MQHPDFDVCDDIGSWFLCCQKNHKIVSFRHCSQWREQQIANILSMILAMSQNTCVFDLWKTKEKFATVCQDKQSMQEKHKSRLTTQNVERFKSSIGCQISFVIVIEWHCNFLGGKMPRPWSRCWCSLIIFLPHRIIFKCNDFGRAEPQWIMVIMEGLLRWLDPTAHDQSCKPQLSHKDSLVLEKGVKKAENAGKHQAMRIGWFSSEQFQSKAHVVEQDLNCVLQEQQEACDGWAADSDESICLLMTSWLHHSSWPRSIGPSSWALGLVMWMQCPKHPLMDEICAWATPWFEHSFRCTPVPCE